MLCENKLTNLVFKAKRIVQNTICFLFLFSFLFLLKKKTPRMNVMQCKSQETKKNKNQKTMVTKRIAMKHKDHESQDRSWTENHTNHLTKCLKLTSIKRFSEDVSILMFNRDIFKSHNLSFNHICQVLKTQVFMYLEL